MKTPETASYSPNTIFAMMLCKALHTDASHDVVGSSNVQIISLKYITFSERNSIAEVTDRSHAA